MKLPLAILALSLSLVGPALADDDRIIRTLRGSWDTGARTIRLDLPPSGITIEAAKDGRTTVELHVRCDRGRRGCEERAENVALDADLGERSFHLRIEDQWTVKTRGLSLRGRIAVPRGAAVEVDMGVGALKISGLDSDLDVDLGVGELKVRAAERTVRSVRVGVGVGEGALAVAGRNVEGSGWLGNSVRWSDGSGKARINLSVGVGEVKVTLD